MKYNKIVVLTGAGVSAESGINTFRASDGLWENHRIEDVATPQGFNRNPELVYRFYNQRRQQLLQPDINPNSAHLALAKLEHKFDGECLIVTQNVDNLHERAGSKKVLHMHGELLTARCCNSNQVISMTEDFDRTTDCLCCTPASRMRPNIVWFGEMPMYMDTIYQALWEADLFIAIGTSGHVYPAAGFVEEANRNGAHTVELNLEPSVVESHFSEKIYGMAGSIVPEFVDNILNHQ